MIALSKIVLICKSTYFSLLFKMQIQNGLIFGSSYLRIPDSACFLESYPNCSSSNADEFRSIFAKYIFYFYFNMDLFTLLKWCQKWDPTSKICRLPIDSVVFNAIIYFKSFHIIHNLFPNNNHLNEHIKIQNQQNLLLKIKYDENSFHLTLNVTKTVLELKFIIANIIGHSANKFYLGTRTKILVESKSLKIYDLRDKQIFINFRIKGGSNTQHLDDNVLATIPPISPHRTFFLDIDNSPNTWLLLLELSFTSSRYNALTKAQHLTALLPTEILQSLGPKIITIMHRDKTECDYFAEISNLTREFYLPSSTELFEKYFRTQSLGTLSPSQFLSKARSDLELLHPGSTANIEILRRSFLAVLPPTARAILAGSENSSLTELASIADKIITNLPTTTVSNIEPSIISLIKDLTDQVATLQLEFSSKRQSRTPSRNQHPQNRDRSKSVNKILCVDHFQYRSSATNCCIGCNWSDKRNCVINQICVYHNVFNSSARRCMEGCTFKKN